MLISYSAHNKALKYDLISLDVDKLMDLSCMSKNVYWCIAQSFTFSKLIMQFLNKREVKVSVIINFYKQTVNNFLESTGYLPIPYILV
jgi:hypothetical protein